MGHTQAEREFGALRRVFWESDSFCDAKLATSHVLLGANYQTIGDHSLSLSLNLIFFTVAWLKIAFSFHFKQISEFF